MNAVTLEDATAKGELGQPRLPRIRASFFPVEPPAERATILARIPLREWGARQSMHLKGDPWAVKHRSSSQDTAETGSGGDFRRYRMLSQQTDRQTMKGSLEGRTARPRCAMPNSQHEPDGGHPPERAVQHGAVSANVFPARRTGEATSSARVQPSEVARMAEFKRATGRWPGANGERRNKTQLATPVRKIDATVFEHIL
ncbi:MAG: hypothetical protein F4Y88_06630 [Chloroflexi bacterium]|nr:hypothetical protein [Chloroflexota bacterium]